MNKVRNNVLKQKAHKVSEFKLVAVDLADLDEDTEEDSSDLDYEESSSNENEEAEEKEIVIKQLTFGRQKTGARKTQVGVLFDE